MLLPAGYNFQRVLEQSENRFEALLYSALTSGQVHNKRASLQAGHSA